MASDETYTKNLILTQLVENMFSEIKKRKDHYFGYRELSPSDYKSRIDVWHELISFWTIGNFSWSKQLYDTYLPLYHINETKKETEKIDLREKHLLHENEKTGKELWELINIPAKFIKLSELKRYFVDIIGIHPPSLLFPKDAEIKDKKLRRSQKAKNECRKIAKRIWKKNPQITIADMIDHEDLLPHTKKEDGKLYTEKTVRNWIKDLCPDRSKGRRKST